ncbi:type II toxin-antitoxin system HicA family toxin [Nostoc sp. CALU 1950]|uniref:type II toxin-antitoxin system HicA family toxin n=1 Tax=Nostoc sp. CALU 1950 TaxID=3104321 RepID=UPI003EBB9DD1
MCQILEMHGFVQVRQRGSHIIMQQRTEDSTLTVPVPNYDELRVGTLRSIIRQSGLPRALFEVT